MEEVLKKLHRQMALRGRPAACEQIMLPNSKRIGGETVMNQHGTYEQIPAEHKGKPVMGCVRDPFDHYISFYEYRNWAHQTPDKVKEIKERFPSFPDLSFNEFLHFFNIFNIRSRVHHERLRADIGMITYSFIQFFFRDPKNAISRLDGSYLDSGKFREDMAEVRFLHTENLNRELHDALAGFGYEKEDIAFILSEGKINVTRERKTPADRDKYYTDELLELVREKDRMMFDLFPEYSR